MAYQPYINPATNKQDLTPNTFSTVGGGTASQAVISQYDLYKPNELIQVFERHTYGGGFRIMLKAMGFNRGTSAPTTGHYEYPWRENLITVGSVVTPAGGAGNNIVIALDAGDMYNPGVSIGAVAQYASYPVKNEILIFRDGSAAMIIDKDTTTNPAVHQLTLRPLDPLVDLDAVVLATESYFVATNAHAEGSELPEGRVPRIIQYHNDFQITKVKAQSTGTELTNEMYFQPIEGMPGSLYLKVKEDMMYTFEKDCDGALIWGQTITNISEFVPRLGHDAPIRGTEGLIQFATTNGNVDNYVAVGGYTLADFRDLARYYEGERVGTNSFMCLMGFELYQEVEQEMADFLNADTAALLTKDFLYGDSEFDNLEDDEYYKEPAEFALKIGFKAIKIGGYNFMFRHFRDFNKIATDKSTGTTRGTFGYEYKIANDGYSREEVIGEITGAGVGGRTIYRAASHGADVHECFMISEFAFHPTCANHITIQKPQ
jgi:hypothetical protein